MKGRILKITPKPAVPPAEHNRAVLEIEVYTDSSLWNWSQENCEQVLKNEGISKDERVEVLNTYDFHFLRSKT